MTEKQTHRETWKEFMGGRSRMTIDMLPDIALLEIFGFYMRVSFRKFREEAWITLVHVCRKWRILIFGSPRRLNLRLYCRARTPVRDMFDSWPPLPIVLMVLKNQKWHLDNIIAAIEHNNRICDFVFINSNFLGLQVSQIENIFAAMQHPFPELTNLQLQPGYKVVVPVVPALFLGGSAPRLRRLHLNSIPFPGLPNLLLSAVHLVDLDISGISDFGYIPPEAMVTGLSVLTRLKRLVIEFDSPRFLPCLENRRLSPETYFLLPVLTTFWFQGVNEYLECLVAWIDAPLLNDLDITFFHQDIFHTAQLALFISRAPMFNARSKADVSFSPNDVSVTLPQQAFNTALRLRILCEISSQQLSSVAQVCHSALLRAFIPAVEYLLIFWDGDEYDWPGGYIENSRWLELLRPFTAVKDFSISSEFTPRIARVLQELSGEGVTYVLPTLRTLLLGEPLPSGPAREAIDQFVAKRQLSKHPVAVSCW